MVKKTLLAQHTEAVELSEKNDASCKLLVSHKIILAWIMKYSIEEYQSYSVAHIAEHFILDNTIQVAKEAVHRDTVESTLYELKRDSEEYHKENVEETGRKLNEDNQMILAADQMVEGGNTEDNSVKEGRVTYDILFRAIRPGNRKDKFMLIDVEIQKDYYPGYPLEKRGIYNCCRSISAQYGKVFVNSHYEKLQKVCSIWLCTNPPQYRQNSISVLNTDMKDMQGKFCVPTENYDLLSVVVVGLKPHLAEEYDQDSVVDMLSVLLSSELEVSERKRILSEVFEIPMSVEIEEEMDRMCNYSAYIEEVGFNKGLKRGIEQGIEQGRQEVNTKSIKNLMKKLMFTAEQAMDVLDIPVEERMLYIDLA